MAASTSHRPPAPSASRTAAAAHQAGEGIRHRVGQKAGAPGVAGDKASRGGSHVAEPDALVLPGARPWLVIDAHTRGPPVPRRRSVLSIPICSSARGRGGFDDHVGHRKETDQVTLTGGRGQVQCHRSLRPVEQVEEPSGTTARTVGASGRLHLDDVCPRLGQQLATEGPGPERGEVDDSGVCEGTGIPGARPNPQGAHG